MLYKFSRRVKINRWANTVNEFGGLEAVIADYWYKWAEVRASNWINLDAFNTRSGNINSQYDQNKWDYDTTIILRYEKDRPTRSNDTIEYEGSYYIINSISINNEYSRNYEVLKCSKIDANINGELPVDNNTIQIVNYNGVGGETSITLGQTIGKTAFAVFKDGIQQTVINSGSPVGKQVFFNSTTGEFIFGIQFELDETATVIYY